MEDDGGALSVSGAEGVRQDGCGERQERDVHQQQGVEEQHHPVGDPDVVEHDVMVGPHLPDEEEGDGVRQVGRPQRGKAMEQVPGVLRRADLQNEQGDGDGEDRIAEKTTRSGLRSVPNPLADPAGSSAGEVAANERNQRIIVAPHLAGAASWRIWRVRLSSSWQERHDPC